MNSIRLGTVMMGLCASLPACTGPAGPAGAPGESAEAGRKGPRGRWGQRGPPARHPSSLRRRRRRHEHSGRVPVAVPRLQRRRRAVPDERPLHRVPGQRRLGDARDGVDHAGRRVRQLPRDRRAPAARHGQRRRRPTAASSPTSRAASSSTATRRRARSRPRTTRGSATVAEVYCTTCHAVTDANDPHKTGIPWTPGSFPLQVADDGGAINIEKSPSTAAVTGTATAERRQLRPRQHVHVVPPVARRRHELPDARPTTRSRASTGDPTRARRRTSSRASAATSTRARPTASPRTSRSSRASTATWCPSPTTATSPTTRSTRSSRRASGATRRRRPST